jgi:DDE domain
LTINGQRHYLWRAVDQDDNGLDILVQSRRNKQGKRNKNSDLGLDPDRLEAPA